MMDAIRNGKSKLATLALIAACSMPVAAQTSSGSTDTSTSSSTPASTQIDDDRGFDMGWLGLIGLLGLMGLRRPKQDSLTHGRTASTAR